MGSQRLTRNVQYALGIFALLINVVAYTMYSGGAVDRAYNKVPHLAAGLPGNAATN